MTTSLEKRIKEMEDFAFAVQNGMIALPTAMGPNTLNKNTIKAKSITGGMIDVTNLSSVNSKTGNLTVDGNLTLGTGGSIRSGKTAYTDTTNGGYFIGLDSGVPKIRVGNAGHTAGWTWDGTALTITGAIESTTGHIGGFTIGATDLTTDTGATGLASSGAYRIWVGDATPASAEFRVTNAGVVYATELYITGGSININSGVFSVSAAGALVASSVSITGGTLNINSGAFAVSAAGILTATGATISGAITATSGSFSGSITATGGTIGGITINSTSISSTGFTLTNAGVMTSTSGTIGGLTIGTSSVTVPSGKTLIVSGGSLEIISDGSAMLQFKTSSTLKGGIYSGSTYWSFVGNNVDMYFYGDTAQIKIADAGNIELKLGDAAGANYFKILDSSGGEMLTVNSDGLLYVPNYIKFGAYGTGASWNGGPVDWLPSATKWVAVKEGGSGTIWYIPAFSANGPWAA